MTMNNRDEAIGRETTKGDAFEVIRKVLAGLRSEDAEVHTPPEPFVIIGWNAVYGDYNFTVSVKCNNTGDYGRTGHFIQEVHLYVSKDEDYKNRTSVTFYDARDTTYTYGLPNIASESFLFVCKRAVELSEQGRVKEANLFMVSDVLKRGKTR